MKFLSMLLVVVFTQVAFATPSQALHGTCSSQTDCAKKARDAKCKNPRSFPRGKTWMWVCLK